VEVSTGKSGRTGNGDLNEDFTSDIVINNRNIAVGELSTLRFTGLLVNVGPNLVMVKFSGLNISPEVDVSGITVGIFRVGSNSRASSRGDGIIESGTEFITKGEANILDASISAGTVSARKVFNLGLDLGVDQNAGLRVVSSDNLEGELNLS
jgi:hypothetical protein